VKNEKRTLATNLYFVEAIKSCDDWGHVIDYHAIVAVTPAFMWYGK